MKRTPRFFVLLVAALVVVPFLPLYIERTLMRSWHADQAGDVIEWSFRICTLGSYWSNYSYFRPEQNPAFWLCANLALALGYALLIALIVDRFSESEES